VAVRLRNLRQLLEGIAGQPGLSCARRPRPARAAALPGRWQIHPVVRNPGPPPRPAARGPGRRRRPAYSPVPRSARVRRAALDRWSAAQTAPGTPRPRPARREPAPGRLLQFRRDLLVRPGYRLGPVPGSSVRLRLRVGHVGQRSVCRSPFGVRRRPVAAERTSKAGSGPGCRTPPAPPPPRVPQPGPGYPGGRPPATAAAGHHTDRLRPVAPAAGSGPARRPAAG